jgi:hypothetical protein
MFGKFQNIIVGIFIVFLTGFMALLLFNYSNYANNWRTPPQKCPDYWVEDNGLCYNIKGTGKCLSQNTGPGSDNPKFYFVDFDNFPGGNSACNKQKWASRCDIAWDGITYGYGNNSPC